jgi:hypothetical protein
MATFNFRSSQGATTTYLPLAGWQYEYAPWLASLRLYIQSNQTDSTMQITSGSETIQETSPILQNTGQLSSINVPVVSWRAAPGDRLKIIVNVVTAGVITGQLIINRLA